MIMKFDFVESGALAKLLLFLISDQNHICESGGSLTAKRNMVVKMKSTSLTSGNSDDFQFYNISLEFPTNRHPKESGEALDVVYKIITTPDQVPLIPPPFPIGTKVKTTHANMSLQKEWTNEAWASKKWGVLGTVLVHHDSHGLCYDVKHEDGTEGCYDPSELEVVSYQFS